MLSSFRAEGITKNPRRVGTEDHEVGMRLSYRPGTAGRGLALLIDYTSGFDLLHMSIFKRMGMRESANLR